MLRVSELEVPTALSIVAAVAAEVPKEIAPVDAVPVLVRNVFWPSKTAPVS